MALELNCPECDRLIRGPELPPGKKIRCPGCRAVFLPTPQGRRRGRQDVIEAPPNEPASSRKPLVLILSLVGGIVLVGAIVGGVLLFAGSKKEATADENVAKSPAPEVRPDRPSIPVSPIPPRVNPQPTPSPFPVEPALTPVVIDDPGALMTIPIPRHARRQIFLPRSGAPSRFVALGGYPGELQVWDLKNGVQVGRIAEDKKCPLNQAVTISSDGSLLAGGHIGASSESTKIPGGQIVENKVDTRAEVWDVARSEPIASISLGAFAKIHWLGFGSKQSHLWVITSDGTKLTEDTLRLRVFDVVGKRQLQDLPLGDKIDGDVSAVDPARERLAVIGKEFLWLIRPEQGQVVSKLPLNAEGTKLPNRHCYGLAFSPDGKELAGLFSIPGRLNYIVPFDPDNLAADLGAAYGLPSNSGFILKDPLEYSPDGTTWLCGHSWIVDQATGTPLHQIERSPDLPRTELCRYTTDGLLVEERRSDQGIYLAVIDPGRDRVAEARASAGNMKVPTLPHPRKVVAGGSKVANFNATAWGVKPPEGELPTLVDFVDLERTAEEVVGVTFSRPARWAMVVSLVEMTEPFEHQVLIGDRIDLTTGKRDGGFRARPPQRYTGLGRDNWQPRMDLSSDGTRFALTHPDQRTRIDLFDVVKGEHLAALDFERESPWLAFADSQTLISEERGKGISAWKVPEGERLWACPLGTESVAMAMSPDNRWLAYATRSGRGFMLEPTTGETKGVLPANFADRRTWFAFTQDGKQLAAIQEVPPEKAALARFNLEAGQVIDQRDSPLPPKRFLPVNDDMIFDAEGHVIDVARGTEMWKYSHQDWEQQLIESPDGRLWYISALGADRPAQLRALKLPGRDVETLLAKLKDRATQVVFGPKRGATVQFNWGGPDAQNNALVLDAGLNRRELLTRGSPTILSITARPIASVRQITIQERRIGLVPEPESRQVSVPRLEVRVTLIVGGRAIWDRTGTVDCGYEANRTYSENDEKAMPTRTYGNAVDWVLGNLPERLYASGGAIFQVPGGSKLPR